MTFRSSNFATKSRFAVSDFLSDIGKVSKGYIQIVVFQPNTPICMYCFDTFPMSERKSETTKREFVARLPLTSVIRICLGRQEGLKQTHSVRVKISPPKMGKVPKIRPKIANDPMRNKQFPVFPSMICVFGRLS